MQTDDPVLADAYRNDAWERDRYSPLPIDPFGAAPHLASRIPGLGGSLAPPNPAYVMESNPLRTAIGQIVFIVEFCDLQATAGTLVLHVLARPEHMKSVSTPVATIAVSMTDLVAHQGIACIGAVGRRNMLYSVSAELSDDSDATASAIRLSLNRREESDPSWRPRDAASKRAALPERGPALRDQPELISMRPPRLAAPVSQPMTPSQLAESIFAERLAELGLADDRSTWAWAEVMLLQSLRYYSALVSGARGLCFDRGVRAMPAYVAAHGGSMTIVRDGPGTAGDAACDTGIEALTRPALCPPETFAGAVHVATAAALDSAEEVADYDFLWTVGLADTPAGKAAFPHFLIDCMRYLRFGGMAVHLVGYGAMDGAATHFTRPEIERMALSLVAQGQEVAQVKFAVAEIGMPEPGAPIPFAILARRTA